MEYKIVKPSDTDKRSLFVLTLDGNLAWSFPNWHSMYRDFIFHYWCGAWVGMGVFTIGNKCDCNKLPPQSYIDLWKTLKNTEINPWK